MDKSKILIGYCEKLFFESIALVLMHNNFLIAGGVENKVLFKRPILNNINILMLETGNLCQQEIDGIRRIRKKYPHLHILIIASAVQPRVAYKIVNEKVEGVILKTCGKHDLLEALHKILLGSKFYCHKVTDLVVEDYNLKNKQQSESVLTRRELSILKKIVQGTTNHQISTDLLISETTVKTHRKNIMAKIGAKNIFGLIRYACREHLIDRDQDKICDSCPCNKQQQVLYE